MSQKSVFLSGEGDAWFERNPKSLDCESDPVIKAIAAIAMSPHRVLEIGCSGGLRLACLHAKYGCDCHGVDPSIKAVQRADAAAGIHLRQGTADSLPYRDAEFDLVIFGFCLYLCDPTDYFRIACEADRVLQDRGFLVILDFNTPIPYKAPYKHRPGIFSRKMDWSRMFLWHPAYRLLARSYAELGSEQTLQVNEALGIDVLRKEAETAFPLNPFAGAKSG